MVSGVTGGTSLLGVGFNLVAARSGVFGPEYSSAQVHPDTLRLRVEIEARHAGLAAEARALGAAVRRGRVVDVVGIDPHRSRLQQARGPMRLLHVAGPDGRAQPVERVVGFRER